MAEDDSERTPERPEDLQDASPRRLTRRHVLQAGLLGGAGLAIAACSSGGGSGAPSSPGRVASAPRPSSQELESVQHVVFVMQENRSFDHYFGSYRGVNGFNDHNGTNLGPFAQSWPANGTSHASQLLPYHVDAATVQAQCAGSSAIPTHDWLPQHQSWASGAMDRFVDVHSMPANDGPTQGPLVMGYFTRSDLPYYYALADAFTLCDNYYCSVQGPTMPNRLYGLSGTLDPAGTHGGPVLDTPSVAEAGPAVGSCSWTTMPEQLSAHGISWKTYQTPGSSVGPLQSIALAENFNALLFFKHFLQQPGSDLYNRAFLPVWPAEFMSDVKQGSLPQVSWILPPVVDSEHPSAVPDRGQSLVSQVVGALVANPDVWSKTVVFVTYDENGGWFDHVNPPTAPAGMPGEYVTASPLPQHAQGVSGPIGLGFRVPMLVISPFSRGGFVNSDTFDHTSLLRFLETRFGVQVPNLSSWRRSAVGDLSSTLSFASPDTAAPQLPDAPDNPPALEASCPDSGQATSLLAAAPPLTIPTHQQMPTQEPGSAHRRS